MPVSLSCPVIANRHATRSSSGQSTVAIIVRLVILRLASSSAAMISAPISRGSGVANRSSSASTRERALDRLNPVDRVGRPPASWRGSPASGCRRQPDAAAHCSQTTRTRRQREQRRHAADREKSPEIERGRSRPAGCSAGCRSASPPSRHWWPRPARSQTAAGRGRGAAPRRSTAARSRRSGCRWRAPPPARRRSRPSAPAAPTGPPRVLGDRAGAQVDKPDSANCAEMIIIANSSARVGRSTALPKSSSVISPAAEQRDDREQRDAGPVDAQPRDPPGRHADIGQDQDQQDDRDVHGGGRRMSPDHRAGAMPGAGPRLR